MTDTPRGHDIHQFAFDECQWQQPANDDPAFDPNIFMTTEGITKTDLAEALREYRNLDTTYPGSPWEALNTLSEDFINWYRWERL